jgi:predicted nucleic acid-binding protein
VKEAGSTRVNTLLKQYAPFSSAILSLEILSALRKRCNVGDLTREQLLCAVTAWNQDRHSWNLLRPEPVVLDRSEQYILTLGLRTLDALHVASARILEERTNLQIVFFTSDERQFAAARQIGMSAELL